MLFYVASSISVDSPTDGFVPFSVKQEDSSVSYSNDFRESKQKSDL
jgi:hypothetical protein